MLYGICSIQERNVVQLLGFAEDRNVNESFVKLHSHMDQQSYTAIWISQDGLHFVCSLLCENNNQPLLTTIMA